MVSPLILRFQPEQGRGGLQPAGVKQRGAGHPGQHRQLCGLQAQRGDPLQHPHTPGQWATFVSSLVSSFVPLC